MNKNKNKLKIVKVKWLDSCTSNTDWKNINSVKGIITCYSVGYLIKVTKKYIVLMPNITGSTNQGCCDITIPRGCIKSIKKLK